MTDINDLPPWPDSIRELDPSDDDRIMWRNDMIYALRERLTLAVETLGYCTGSGHVLLCSADEEKLLGVIAACKEPS